MGVKVKLKNLIVISILIVIFFPLSIKAISYTEWGNQGGGGTGLGCAGRNSCWPNSSSNSNNQSTNGFRISFYKLDNGNVKKLGESWDFLNDATAVKNLQGDSGIKYISGKNGKVDYLLGNSFSATNSSHFGSNIKYAYFENFLSDSLNQNLNIRAFFSRNSDLIDTLFQKYIDDDLNKFYFVIEPITLLIYNYNTSNKIYFYGTSYEHIRYVSETSGVQYGWVSSVTNRILPYSLRIESVINSEGKSVNSFLKAINHLNSRLAKPTSTSHIKSGYCNKKNSAGVCIEYYDTFKNDIIKNYTYGMYILNATGNINPGIKETECNNSITSNNCGNITIKEDNSRLCTIGNAEYFFDNYNDSTEIYCTNNVYSEFENFYNTFNSTIRSGSYFPMHGLYITTEKTCYIKNVSSQSRGWEKSIYENFNGDISLKLGNLTYKLEEKKKSEDVICQYSSNGVCTKATLKTTHNYNLNPLVNRFISIETMQQDKNNFQTSNNIDNGGPRLTVPLNYLNGIYKYNLDLTHSLFSLFRTRIVNKINKNIVIDGQRYNITYKTNKTISDSVLSFSCAYKVTQDQCEDENGNLVPCPVDGCANLPEDKCCINGKVTDCPVACSGECCDSNGNEIECPGGESVIGNVIYRPISLTNPFPGIDGANRIPGNNWNKIITKDGRTYSASDYYIKYNRGYNDYEVYQAEPLYVINLDANKIKAIRKYNDYKKHDYNDFDLECDNGKNCISKFLRGRAKNFNIYLLDKERGTCRNITTNEESFNKCLCRKGEDC